MMNTSDLTNTTVHRYINSILYRGISLLPDVEGYVVYLITVHAFNRFTFLTAMNSLALEHELPIPGWKKVYALKAPPHNFPEYL